MSRARPVRFGFGLFALIAGGALACSSPKSFVVLDLEVAPGFTTPITGVASVHVSVTQGAISMKELTYPATDLVIDVLPDAGTAAGDGGAVPPKNLSVDFSNAVSGTVSFDVTAFDANGCSLGRGRTDLVLRRGGVAEAVVPLKPAKDCGLDGGASDGGNDDATFPGCDPMNPSSGAGLACASGQVCQVDCDYQKTDCVPGGTGAPGSVCKTNADCAPGTQCFDYAQPNTQCAADGGTGSAAKVCLQFCHGKADCAAFGAGGGGSGSVCEGLVVCKTLTNYHTCTFNCDPTAAAALNHGGCPGALVCVMPASMDAVDCTCPELTRTKNEGDACTSGADCRPGLICNQMNGVKTCRPICRCEAKNGACTPGAGTCPTANTTCHPVTNDTLFGICL